MNDSGSTPTEKFVANMGDMLQRIRGIKARPVILAASPVNDGTTMARLAGRNVRLDEYAKALKPFAAKEEVPYADQFHALIDIWGRNKPGETLANTLPGLRQAAADDKLAGVEHLRAFLAEQDKSPGKLVSMQGDPVHPGPPGQLLMAAALLKALGADGFVSSATLDAAGKVVESKGCQIENLKAAVDDVGLVFNRLDERLWFPIPEEARAATAIDPTPFEMSQYTLKVTGLKPGSYAVRINGIAVATVSDTALARGVNLTEFGPQPDPKGVSPIIAQSKAILDAVAAKEAIVSQWRGLSQRAHAPGASPDLKEQLAALTRKVEEADAKIRAAADPKKMKFEIVAVSQ
jgi:lysophospholipase L1-like esterase